MNFDLEPLPDAPADTTPDAPPAPAPFDPYAGSRHMPWMDRSLSPSARAASRLRPELANFAAIEGRDPNHADIDAMVGRISSDLIEILRREWAADVLNERLEERAAEREGRPVDPSIGPKPLPLGGDPRDTRTGVFVAQPEDIDWVFERFGRQRPDIVQANFGGRPVKRPFPGARPFPPAAAPPPPILWPAPIPDQQPGGSFMTPVDPEMQPASPPPFPAATPMPPIPPSPARKPLLPAFEALIPPNLKEIFQPIPGSEVIANSGGPFYIPGPLIGDPGLQIPVHILSAMLGGKENDVRMISGLVDPDELIKRYKYYGPLEELARKAGDIVGEGKGRVHGTHVHKALEKLIEAETEAGHLPKGMRAEISFVPDSVETPYGTKGSMRIDVIEEVDENTIYVYELKTGGAALKEPRIDRTLRYFKGKTTVIVMELNPWRLPRK